jgi:hypothetical protein
MRRALPKGTIVAHGYESQFVAVIPSKDLLVLRFGSTKEKGT